MSPRRTAAAATLLISVLVATGCSEGGEETAERTQAQRDSAVAESGLPGSGAVGTALDAAAAAEARAEQHDTIR